ncbi:sigma-70 family RNA polymerase sigma factor [Singulisphaera sp. PoT]|uniref:sigma-70 family RNA polymerase sigma factor n=1 Tax=Singulisphaera sp. PoT TaxID=3411797 RepID=UPI003BF5B0B2
MSHDRSGVLHRQLQGLLRHGSVAGVPDQELLDRFAERRDGQAFSALVERHGPMVLGVCRRILGDRDAAEDAFQATFLILVRKAGVIRLDSSLGRWLYTVTRRVALRARAEALHFERRTSSIDEPHARDPSQEAERRDWQVALHEELGRLPESQRAAVVLCYMEGLTHEEAARYLGWPLGTVKGRLSRARALLRTRLARRGFGLTTVTLVACMRPAAVSASLLTETVSVAMGIATGRALITATAPASLVLAKGVLDRMFFSQIKVVATILLGTGLTVGLTGFGAHRMLSTPAVAGSPDDRAKNVGTLDDDNVRRANRGKLDGVLTLEKRPADAKPAPTHGSDISPVEYTVGPNDEQANPKANPFLLTGKKRAMPEYIVEPPDILKIEVEEALPGRPIRGERLVRPDGKISLGSYGELEVVGLTPLQIKEKLIDQLRHYLSAEALGLERTHGNMTDQISPRDSDRVTVTVAATNSKTFIVDGAVPTPGRFPITGNETVLDAIQLAGGLLANAKTKAIRVVRPTPVGNHVLPVDLDGIVQRGDTTTNYQIFSGDRLEVGSMPIGDGTRPRRSRREIEAQIDAIIGQLKELKSELAEGEPRP